MKIKRFTGNSIQEVFAKVKMEVGPDAVILNNRQVREGGIFGLFSKKIVEVTVDLGVEKKKETPGRFAFFPSIKKVFGKKDVNVSSQKEDLNPKSSNALGNPPSWQTPILQSELNEMKVILRPKLKIKGHEENTNLSLPFQKMFQSLLHRGVHEDIAKSLLRQLEAESPQFFSDSQLQAQKAFREWLIPYIKTSGPIKVVSGKSKIVAVIGPTGVGKTTTLAKLAAHYSLKENRKIALVTLDTYRIAAVEQLRTYAKILDVGLGVATKPQELSIIFNNFKDRDLILMDTAGMSPYGSRQLKDLQELFRGWNVEIYLLISAITNFSDMKTIYDHFSVLPLKRVIITKVDETKNHGVLLNAAIQFPIPISYLTIGQNVPQDIEIADPSRIARYIIDNRP